MRWQGGRQSDNVEDIRDENGGQQSGFSQGGLGGRGGLIGPAFQLVRGGGISGIIILVVAFFGMQAIGLDPIQFLLTGNLAPVQTTSQKPASQTSGSQISGAASGPRNDEMTQFVRTVLAETEDTWSGIFKANGGTYVPPKLVLFSDQVRSACGLAGAASGPFYCPGDRKVYIDLSFYNELSTRFGASGDFAEAYVLAHEVGHHVQNLLGILPRFNQARQSMSEDDANKMSVRVELQADCFAGIWGYYTNQKGIVEQGDLEEAINAAHQIGDDTLQKRTQGYVVPETFNHGTSAQRAKWFTQGYESGKLDACDTFSGGI